MKIVIIGGKGTAIVIADQIYDAHLRFGVDMEVIGLALDDLSDGNEICGYPIICGISEVYERFKDVDDVKFIYSLYRSDKIKERTRLLYSLNIPENKWANFIHPLSMISRSVKMGYGNVILSHCVINCNTVLGNFNTLNSGAHIGHDAKIGNNNFFAAKATVGSSLEIGNMNFIGIAACIKPGCSIGDENLVGQCANVTHNFDRCETIFGNPAKSHGAIKKKENKKY